MITARADPTHPYESVPNLLLVIDPGSGTFRFLALIGLIRQLPSTFAYDPGSGVFQSAAVLGVPKYETGADLRIVAADRKDMGTPIYSGPHFAVRRNQD
jgi:hypothetical protein